VKGGQVQYDDDGAIYTVYFYDGPEVHLCTIWKDVVPDGILGCGYSQAQNDSDKSDFETNYKPTANTAITKRAADGRMVSVHSIVKYTKNFSLRAFSFQTSTPSSMHNCSPTAAMGDVTMKCYDGSGTDVTSSPSTAVKTVLDLEPSFLYEVIGGWVDIPDASRTAIATDGPQTWYMSAIGVPDVPGAYGGSIPFVHEVDLALIPTGSSHVVSDGRATSLMIPNGTYHTGKLRWIVKHPTGAARWFQILVETFQ
jgi:hypothetical protein